MVAEVCCTDLHKVVVGLLLCPFIVREHKMRVVGAVTAVGELKVCS